MFESIDIEISTNCNLRCGYCPNHDHFRGHHDMKKHVFLLIASELGQLNFDGRVSLNLYNEPLININQLTICLEALKEYAPKCKVLLYTNGTKLTEEIYEKYKTLVDSYNITEHVSLDGKFFKEKQYPDITIRRFTSEDKLHNRCGLVNHPWARDKVAQCWAKRKAMYINYKGDALICCNDFLGLATYGNIESESLLDIWNSAKLKQDRKDIKDNIYKLDICQRCNYVGCI